MGNAALGTGPRKGGCEEGVRWGLSRLAPHCVSWTRSLISASLFPGRSTSPPQNHSCYEAGTSMFLKVQHFLSRLHTKWPVAPLPAGACPHRRPSPTGTVLTQLVLKEVAGGWLHGEYAAVSSAARAPELTEGCGCRGSRHLKGQGSHQAPPAGLCWSPVLTWYPAPFGALPLASPELSVPTHPLRQ